MNKTRRGLVLAVLMPLLTGAPAARADFLVANPSPNAPAQLPAPQGLDGAHIPSAVVFDRARKAPEEPGEEDESAGREDWRETMMASYGLFLLTLFAGHAPPPPPDNPTPVVSSNSGGGGGGGTDPHQNPEPATVVLGLLGGSALALVHLRKRRKQQEMPAN